MLIVLLLAGCKQHTTAGAGPAAITGIDSTRRPGDNFFMYVNGTWYDSASIPPGQTGVGSYSFLNYPQRIRLQRILDSLASKTHAAGTLEQKVGDFYASGMDTNAIDKRGYEPIRPILETIDAVTDLPSLLKLIAKEQVSGNASLIGLSVGADNRKSTMNIAQLYQGGINLPERDYYFKTDSATAAIRLAYERFISRLLTLSGTDTTTAARQAGLVFGIEKQLAGSHKSNIELRDVNGNYYKLAVTDLSRKHPNLQWNVLLGDLGVRTDSLNLAQPAYYDKLNTLLKAVPVADWKVYLKASTLLNYADILSRPFADAAFEYTKALTGQAVRKSRAEEMTQAVDRSLGHALAQLYVKQYFPDEAKKRMTELVANLEKAFEERINRLDWMSDSTKIKAKEKLDAFTEKIGYPDKWRDYTAVTVSKDRYFENVLSANRNDYNWRIQKIGQPVDRTEWYTTPPTVTAYNNPPMNEIVFPAGILQPPYFDMNADDALNYGGIGMVIGHEITHSFDDQGAQYDKVGNVTNWWTAPDYQKFKAHTQQVIDQYDSFTMFDSLHLKGALTVGENTADLAGIAIAYDAFKMTAQGKDTTRIDGFTPDQRFFISIARIWRVKTTDEFMRMYINVNPHSPATWRVNGPLMNFTPFYQAFNVKEGERMYKPEAERIRVW